MPFQPFGYHFEVRSELSTDAVKAAIRSRKKGMYDAKSGARGWIVGPFMNLILSRDRDTPMLMGCILRDGVGTRISGRAGYVATIGILILIPAFIPFFYLMLTRGGYTFREIEIFSGTAVLAALLVCSWRNHRDAEPLVRFLRDTIENPGGPSRTKPAKPVVLPPADSFLKTLTLEESGSDMDGPVTPVMVKESLQAIDGDGFVILSSAEEKYVQTVPEGDGFVVEKRDGDDEHHYRAARRGSTDSKDVFTFEETLAIFLAYGSGAAMPAFVEWKKTRV